MITENEIKNVFSSMVPASGIIFTDYPDVHKMMNRFANYTKEVIKKGNLPIVRDCFKTADFLLKEGNKEIKNAVGNVYVFSIAMFLDVTGAVSRQVKEMLPVALLEEYQRQVNSFSFP